MTSPLDIRPDHLEIVQGILREHLPMGVKVWVFGSRANWSTKDSSDLDLALESETKLTHKVIGALKDAFEDSALPYTVDVVDLSRTADSFRQIVESQRVSLPLDGDGTGKRVRLHAPLSGVSYGDGTALSVTSGQWRRVALADLIDLQLSSVDKKSKANERAVQLCNYTDVYNNSFIHAGMDFMAATATEREITKCSLVAGDVVITKDSEKHDDIGVPALVREDVPNLVCGYHLAILRPRLPEIDGTYLFYALSTDEIQQQFHSFANGITRFGLRKADIGLVEIPLPPPPEQRAIAHILGTLDDKIELNRRMNETLEAMARALFKSWFVDFDPVRAKMEGRWRRGDSLPGLPADLYDLFPDRLVPSELGEIPDGWEVKALGECYDLTMGQSPPGSTYNDNGKGTPFFQGSTDFGERYPTNRRYCTQPARLAQTEDTLVSVRAPVGAINRAWERCCIGRGVAALRHNSGSAPYTYYAIWAAQPEIDQYEHTGTVFGAIGGKQFRALQVLEPPEETIAAFHRVGRDLDGRIRSNVDESRALATRRDALLPRLVSGYFRVEMADEGAESNSIPMHGVGARSAGDAVSPH